MNQKCVRPIFENFQTHVKICEKYVVWVLLKFIDQSENQSCIEQQLYKLPNYKILNA